MSQTVNKNKLSGSTSGKGIKIVATSSTGTTIHTAVASTSATVWDEIWLYAYNGHTDDVQLTIEWGETTVPDGNIIVNIPKKAGRFLVVDGRLLQNSLVVTAFAATANVIIIDGFVNAIS